MEGTEYAFTIQINKVGTTQNDYKPIEQWLLNACIDEQLQFVYETGGVHNMVHMHGWIKLNNVFRFLNIKKINKLATINYKPMDDKAKWIHYMMKTGTPLHDCIKKVEILPQPQD